MDSKVGSVLQRLASDTAELRMLVQHPTTTGVFSSEVESQVSSTIQQLAWVQEYVGARGAYGCGDSGHSRAGGRAQKHVKAVRKTLGYIQP